MYRNYELGRDVDCKTKEFEQELNALVKKYGAYIETESFGEPEKVVTECSNCLTMNTAEAEDIYLQLCSNCRKVVVFCDSCENRKADVCFLCENGSKHSLRWQS